MAEELDYRYVVSTRSHLVLGLTCILFFGAGSVGAFLAQEYWPILIFGTFMVAGAYLVASSGCYELTSDGIVHRNSFGQFEMRWSDVRQVELGAQGAVVLHGTDKRFVVFPVSAWSGPDRLNAAETLSAKLKAASVSTYSSKSADYKVHKNTRV